MENEFIAINTLRYPRLAKCNCCNRVRDIYYMAVIYAVDNKETIVGDLELCKQCGDNFYRALGNDLDADQKVVKEFKFD